MQVAGLEPLGQATVEVAPPPAVVDLRFAAEPLAEAPDGALAALNRLLVAYRKTQSALKERVAACGRPANQLLVLPGISAMIGSTGVGPVPWTKLAA